MKIKELLPLKVYPFTLKLTTDNPDESAHNELIYLDLLHLPSCL